ncbi:chaperone protein dnaJ 8, chloroplastic-like [Vicia villosa]|uniref:chaperone protein dnaJ 8, chloroplastic-like n=1 Tax=Vicia villosa TaxID=3911 RepID=UPI00273B2298|nr:chaperone protein dnaJ 8, chloroplastic-like [Vicia villosa]
MAAATTAGVISGNGSSVSWRRKEKKMNRVRVFCSSSSSVMDSYKTLRIQPDASESDVKKAFRQLALQYHPDVCKGKDSGVQFHQINEAYDVVMAKLREEPKKAKKATLDEESFRGMNDPDWEYWEGGWEGAWTSHINPYIVYDIGN